MTKKAKTHVAIVLDRSGSMWSQRDKTVEGYNEQIQQLKIDAQDQDITCSLVTFNGDVVEHLWKVPANDLKESTFESYNPGGSTAYLDAIGYTIDKLMVEDDGDEETAYLFIMISDGDENASSHYPNNKIIREIVDGAKGSGRWTFNFMGCSESDLDKIEKATGVDKANMAVWSNRSGKETARAFGQSRNKMSQYFGSRASGKLSSATFHSDESGVSMNYTDAAMDANDQDADLNSFKQSLAEHSAESTNERADVFAVTGDNRVLTSGQHYARPKHD